MVEEIHRPEGDTNTAKQSEVLLADIEHAGKWIETVWAIFDRRLPYEEFVDAYMAALHEWEHGRKLTQHQLHWRYGPSRRPRRLIEKDTRKQSALAAERLERDLTRLIEHHPELETRNPSLLTRMQGLRDAMHSIATAPETASPPTPKPTRRTFRDLDTIPTEVAKTVTKASGIRDLTRATDATIFRSMTLRGVPEQTALQLIRALKGLDQ